MPDYAPASSMGWLDLDTAASERVATLLRSLDEPGTLDVLGLGTIRDALSDMLTPGTSTVQTRLRYFIFVPWIFRRLEADGVTPASFTRTLRDYEAKLIDCLRSGGDDGVIGARAGRKLKRMPSDIYWRGLAAWGMRHHPLSIAEHGQRIAARKRQSIERDEDGNATEPTAPMWAAIPPEPDGFLKRPIDFELQPEEAEVLTDGIRRRHPETLVPVLSDQPALTLDAIDYPWLLPANCLPDRLSETLRHARCFSELAHGPGLVYNLLVARKARDDLGWSTEESVDRQVARLGSWAALVERRHESLRSWVDEPEEFHRLLAGHNIASAAFRFWHDLARRAVDDPAGFAENPKVHQLVIGRERRLKTTRARLSNRAALEVGGQPASVDRLDYRWGITKTYLQDLAAAEDLRAAGVQG